MKIKADLHIHSTLSPCGSLDMSPNAIVQRALSLSLDAIAVTDHNSVQNSFYAAEAGKRHGLYFFYGLEAQTAEEAHVLCLFEDRHRTEKFYADIYPSLPDIKNNPDYFGDQVIVDEHDNIIGFEEKLLLNSLNLSISELMEKVLQYQTIKMQIIQWSLF